MMFSNSNLKLGSNLIWSFGLPSITTCPGRSSVCEEHCYSAHIESLRPAVRASYERNLAASKRADFVKRAVAFIIAHEIKVVRISTGGDLYSAGYARKWLAIMRQLPHVRFFLYSRTWRVEAIRRVLVKMARRRNVRLWYSCDRETGVPDEVPKRVRVAWLMTSEDDVPPEGTHLVFRVRRLRRKPAKRIGLTLVCPVENGATGHLTDCQRCAVCWK
jgi:hypothetical protein